MKEEHNTPQTGKPTMSKKRTLVISLLVLMAGAVVTVVIFSTEPKAVRGGATKKTAMLVDVTGVERGTYYPTIVAMGTVTPSQDIILSPRISGEVLDLSESFTPGGFVSKGENLLQIDPSDYRNILEQRKSDLRQAVADLNLEMGRQDVAESDYKLLDETLSKEQEELILRKPQLNSARSRVESARAAVDQAELNLKRTTIKAPFDAHILTRNVNVGSQVSPGENLARLVGIDNYWVEATVPLSKLRWLTFPEDEQKKGSKVKIRNRSAWPAEEYRQGYLYKMVGALEDQTRMARVLVSVPDPLAHEKGAADLPALIIGSFVETQIQARPVENVIRLSRDLVRKNETVWVMEDKKLRIRDVQIVFRDSQYAYITEGLSDGDQVVTTNLTTVVDGAGLRVASDTTSTDQELSDNETKE